MTILFAPASAPLFAPAFAIACLLADRSARSVAASYKPPALVTRVRLPACASFSTQPAAALRAGLSLSASGQAALAAVLALRRSWKSIPPQFPDKAVIAQLVARRSHNPKVVSLILARRDFPSPLVPIASDVIEPSRISSF